MKDDIFLIRQDVLEGEIPNYLILLPGGGHTLSDIKWASRFDSHSAEEALAMVQKAWPTSTFRKVPVEEAPWAGDICVGGDFWITVDINGLPCGPAYTEKEEASAKLTAERLSKNVPQHAPYTAHRYVSAWRLQSSQEWYAARWERLDQLVREEATEDFKKRWFSTMANGTPGMHDPPTFARLLSTRNLEIHQLMEQRQLTPVQLANAVDQLRGDDASLFARTYAELPTRDDAEVDPLYTAISTTPRRDARELRAQLAAITEALGPRVAKDETPAQAVARLVEGCVTIVKRNDEYFASARRNAEENEELKKELAGTKAALEAVCTTFPPDTDIRFVMSAIIGVACEHEDGRTVIQYIGQLERLLKAARENLPDDEVTRG